MPSLPHPSEDSFHDEGTSHRGTWFLITDFIQPISAPSFAPDQRLAYKLAKLHSTPAPVNGGKTPGFPVTTYCGSTPQPNVPVPSSREGAGQWAGFFSKRRLGAIAAKCPQSGGEFGALVRRMCEEVVPDVMEEEEEEEMMVVVHGDLWAGNFTAGRVERIWGGEADSTGKRNVAREVIDGEWVFDPSVREPPLLVPCIGRYKILTTHQACYAPATYDHGIMNLFGGFSRTFWNGYWTHRREFSSLASPQNGTKVVAVKEASEGCRRWKVYELYHQLNHYVIFGGSYGWNAREMMRELVAGIRMDGNGR